MKNKVIIYHGNCMDGKASAWVAWKKFSDEAIYVPVEDRKVLPDFLREDVDQIKNLEVYVIDFCYPKDVLLDLEKRVKKLVVLDHHISSKENTESVREHVYSEIHSGAMIAWKYFFADLSVPKIIQYVSDNDAHQHKLADRKNITAYIYSFHNSMSFEDFSYISERLENDFEACNERGVELARVRSIYINDFINKAEELEFDGHKIYAVNAHKEFRGEVATALAEKTNTFGMVYYYENGLWKVSLRSVPDFDVSKIAEKYGGGGQKNSAAFFVKTNFPIDFNKFKNKNI